MGGERTQNGSHFHHKRLLYRGNYKSSKWLSYKFALHRFLRAEEESTIEPRCTELAGWRARAEGGNHLERAMSANKRFKDRLCSDRCAGFYVNMDHVCDAEVPRTITATSPVTPFTEICLPPIFICVFLHHVFTSGIEWSRNLCLDLWQLWNCQRSSRSAPAPNSPDLSTSLHQITW